jgi:hypothetical protein
MRINELKTALNVTTGIDVDKVIFDPMQELNNTSRGYPTIMWDLNSLRFVTRAQNPNNIQNKSAETVYQIRVYILGWIDERGVNNITTKHVLWEKLHGQFEEYLAKVNSEDSKVQILPNLEGEFFTEGTTSTESEIAIAYDVTIHQSC